MRRIGQSMVTLPLAVIPLVMLVGGPAVGETVTPLQAFELLVKTKAADTKCHYLSDADRQELSDYVARGEIAAAERSGVDSTKSASAAGREKGEQADCAPNGRAEVEATLIAARQAVVSAEMRHMPEPALQTGSISPDAQKKNDERKKQAGMERTDDGLAAYRQEAMAYYVELRCAHLSQSNAKSFWRLIVARHHSAIARYGVAAVRAALKSAESTAAAKTCSSRTAMLVRDNYAALRR